MRRVLFRFDGEASVAGWRAVDDAVLGGVSASRLVGATPGRALDAIAVDGAVNDDGRGRR